MPRDERECVIEWATSGGQAGVDCMLQFNEVPTDGGAVFEAGVHHNDHRSRLVEMTYSTAVCSVHESSVKEPVLAQTVKPEPEIV